MGNARRIHRVSCAGAFTLRVTILNFRCRVRESYWAARARARLVAAGARGHRARVSRPREIDVRAAAAGALTYAGRWPIVLGEFKLKPAECASNHARLGFLYSLPTRSF
ncbi:hypothetical protein EVAR_98217_1 [Eumeta japonica]|uniref:Uncharacterized protein n=1 Tax=Eumeta variegata TaxID=151549 RepID=A0A4C1Y7W0_EUMVA|nr:hypothetical protein EVAR_98217_1 [Eumeta japonica]